METSPWPITFSSWVGIYLPLHSVRHCLCIPWLIHWKLHLKGPKTISNVDHLGAWNHDNLASLLGENHFINDDTCTRGLVISLVSWFFAQVQHLLKVEIVESLSYFRDSDSSYYPRTIPPNIAIDIQMFCVSVCVKYIYFHNLLATARRELCFTTPLETKQSQQDIMS